MALGKRNVISDRVEDYNFMIIGEGGIGKTTLFYELCDRLFGDAGYILLNIGFEDGVKALDGVIYENVLSFKDLKRYAGEIIKNKNTDYKDLKVIVIDTLDQLIPMAQEAALEEWNTKGMSKKGFEPAASIAGAWGGFGKGEARARQLIIDIENALKKAGVRVWYSGHTKTSDKVDALTGAGYTTLSSNLTQKDFDEFKNHVDLVGVCCIDRTIEAEGTGRVNIVNHKEITRNEVKSQRRLIKFRDDSYSVDSKSRFAHICSEIPLDTDSFIQAVKDAIEASKRKKPGTVTDVIAEQEASAPVKPAEEDPFEASDLEAMEDALLDFNAETETTSDREYPADILGAIKAAVAKADKDTKLTVKSKLTEFGKTLSSPMSEEEYRTIYDILVPAA